MGRAMLRDQPPSSEHFPSLSLCSLWSTGLLHRRGLPARPGDLAAVDPLAQSSPSLVSGGALPAFALGAA